MYLLLVWIPLPAICFMMALGGHGSLLGSMRLLLSLPAVGARVIWIYLSEERTVKFITRRILMEIGVIGRAPGKKSSIRRHLVSPVRTTTTMLLQWVPIQSRIHSRIRKVRPK